MNPWVRSDTMAKWEMALIRTALAVGIVLLAAQAWARVFLQGLIRQSVEEILAPVALLAGAYLLCCAVAAWVRGKRLLCLALALVGAASAVVALLPAILGEAVRN